MENKSSCGGKCPCENCTCGSDCKCVEIKKPQCDPCIDFMNQKIQIILKIFYIFKIE